MTDALLWKHLYPATVASLLFVTKRHILVSDFVLGEECPQSNISDRFNRIVTKMTTQSPIISSGCRISRWGRRPLMWVIFGDNVCENKRIGSRLEGALPTPPRSTNDNYFLFNFVLLRFIMLFSYFVMLCYTVIPI